MRCEKLREWISAEIDGEASWRERAELWPHLLVCRPCRRARSAALNLRKQLGPMLPTTECGQDEILLAKLRLEGICRDGGTVQGDVLPEADGAYPPAVGSPSWLVLHPQIVRRFLPKRLPGWDCRVSLWPAVAAMSASLLLTWGSLRWAELGPATAPQITGASSAAAPSHAPVTEVIDQWLAGPPTLAAMSRLQQTNSHRGLPTSFPRQGGLAVPLKKLG